MSLVRSFLGEAALRLQRLLDLDALVQPAYDTGEKIIPVVIVGDGERPGMGDQRGRRFSIGFIAGGAVSVDLVLPPTALRPVQIDVVTVNCDTAGRLTLRYLSPADVAGIGAVTQDGRMLDGNQTEELSPMARTTGGAGGADIAYGRCVANGCWSWNFPFQLMPGAGLQAIGAGGTTDFTVMGRVF